MPVFDYEIFDMLTDIKEHYGSNMNNSYIRSALLSLDLPYKQRDSIENITNKIEIYRGQGYKFEELYSGIYGMALFTYKVRLDILPKLKGRGPLQGSSPSERVLAVMAVDNLAANLNILADKLNELYLKVVKLDVKSHKVKSPVYTRMEELDKLGQLLTSTTPGLA